MLEIHFTITFVYAVAWKFSLVLLCQTMRSGTLLILLKILGLVDLFSEGLMRARRLDLAHETGSRASKCIVWVVWSPGIAIPFEWSSKLLLHHIESSHEVY